MPYLRCPSCGLLAHVPGEEPVQCSRCRSFGRHALLLPLEESLAHIDISPVAAGEHPDDDPAA
jgi:hypothetical protein